MSSKETTSGGLHESALYSNKEVKIIAAAQKLFLRHGLKKASMSEIAEAAELSRPSLYAAFANKEAVVDGIMKLHIEMNQTKNKKRVNPDMPLQAQIEEICEIWITEPFASAIDKEYGKDLMVTIEEFARETVNQMYAEFEKCLVDALKPHMKTVLKKRGGLSPKDVAHIIASATKGLKVSADTLPELRRLVKGLITMTLALVES